MQSIEISGKTVAEATEAAAAKLGVTADNLEVKVLEQTSGLFGKSTVRIFAEVKSAAPAAPAAAVVEEPKPAKGKGRAKKAEAADEPPAAPAAVEAKEEKPEKPKRGKKDAKPATEEPAPEHAAENGHEGATETVATDADAEQIVGMVDDLMQKAGLTVSVKAAGLSGRYVTVELDGKDAAYLVGKQGEVLNATQYLVNIIAGRRFNNGVRANLDGNNYREKREARLELMATELAKQVIARGEEAVLDALPAFERRIVHKVLSSMEGISTYSEGEEPNRRVVIAPAD